MQQRLHIYCLLLTNEPEIHIIPKDIFSLGHGVPKDCKEQPSKPDQWDFKLNPAREEDKSPWLNGLCELRTELCILM